MTSSKWWRGATSLLDKTAIGTFHTKVITSPAVDGAVSVWDNCGVSIVALCQWRVPLS